MEEIEYNTQRKPLVLPAYGRYVQQMVDYLLTIDNREKRTRQARLVLRVMATITSHLRNVKDYEQKLWNHLYIMSGYRLDVDSGYPNPLRAEVEAIAHPIIRMAAEERLRAAAQAQKRAAVLDVPLLFEAGWDALADEIWVVALPREEQLARLLARDKDMTEREARARIAAQMPLAEKCARADVVIDNSGTVEEIREYIGKLWKERILERA